MSTLIGAAVEVAEKKTEDVVTTTSTPPPVVDRDPIARLVGGAREQGASVDGEDGLLAQLTELVVKSALESAS
ncbi:hypothetical protein ACFQ23_06395 [Schaalia naturae]|jgi:hypothetical protein|uniref:Transposase n=1 Tax=Schaalia naturae TaxID=635203 RepID=A0ABW2SL33_9ACTO